MSDHVVRVSRIDDLAAIRRLGVACGLDDSGPGDEHIETAWGAFDGERLVGAVCLERRQGLEVVNWMAVDAAYRRRGIARRLCRALEQEARQRGVTRIWVTARTPAFFLSLGYTAVPEGDERSILLGECPRCRQYGRGCEPQALTKHIDDTGPLPGPRRKGET